MAKAGYSLSTSAAVALTAATAKTILAVRGPSSFGIDLQEASVSFDGVTAAAVPVLVELVRITFATNAPGTNSTDVAANIVQDYGRVVAHGTTAGQTWTAEPTAITTIRRITIHPQAGVIYQIPLGRTPDSDVSNGFGLRLNAPAAVNVNAYLAWERS